MIHNIVKKNAYFDSVTLMLISSRLTDIKGVKEAAVMMGTQHNIELMKNSGVLTAEVASEVSENDLIIGINAESQETIDAAMQEIEAQFNKKATSQASTQTRVRTVKEAKEAKPDLNFAVVSIPGRYAASEVSRLLDNDMNVLLFSDNVSLEEELQLKRKAVEKNLLMMGPDCGTAIINGVALGFANVVRRGNIGLVAASGTGLQEVTVIIDKLGGGISQALGTGGRDLKSEIGGKMMSLALDALHHDSSTDVIGIISKPPSADVMQKILNQIQGFTKPVVVCFLGGDPAILIDSKVAFAETLEELAHRLVNVVQGQPVDQAVNLDLSDNDRLFIAEAKAKLSPEQKYVRALYTGGTLAFESLLLLDQQFGVYSNIAKKPEYQLEDVEKSIKNTVLDMGEDYFTDGMPHPMIDPRLRSERLIKEVEDVNTAVVLLDCVLGYGSHESPAKVMAQAIQQAKSHQKQEYVAYVASVCGTDKDPQTLSEQVKLLQEAGVYVVETNAQAARVAAGILKRG